MSLLTIVIPVYNEQESLDMFLPEVIEHCKSEGYHLVIVNDGSKDNSLNILNSLQSKSDFDFTIISHKLNKGYGGALKTGIINSSTDYLITIDADGQHYLEDVDLLFQKTLSTDADLIVGSRKAIKSATFARGIGKSIIRGIAKLLMTVPIYDINSGMKIYNTGLVKSYLHLTPNNMSFSDTIALVFIHNRHLVLEEPIRLKDRYAGTSTIGVKTAFDTVLEIINIIVLFNPMRIFIPVSLFCLLTGLFWGSYIFILGRGVSVGASTLIISGTIIFLLGLIAEQLSALRKQKVIN